MPHCFHRMVIGSLVTVRWLQASSTTLLRRCLSQSTSLNLRVQSRSKSSTRLKNVLKAKAEPMPRGDHEEFVLIYRLNHMRWIASLSRMKLLQTGLLTCLCATSGYLVYIGQASLNGFYITTLMATLAVLVLFLISHYSRRLIGLVWLDKSKETLKIAHLTFWGQRKDMIYPLVKVGEMSDVTQDKRNIFLKMKIRNSPDYFYYTLHGSHVPHKSMFSHVFGNSCLKLYNAKHRTLK